MLNNKTFLAIVPARGGSKRLPRKNILDLNGKPLIAWTIEAGLKSKYIDKVVVTSEDNEILAISKKYGADTILRPDELASDTATTFDSIKHTVDNYEKYDYVVLLQATSPLRDEKHIDEAIELFEFKNADATVSVCEMDHSPLWSNTLDDSLSIRCFLRDEVLNKRSQDLEKYYRLNGAIYICKTEKLLKEKSFFLKDDIFAYKMDRKSSIDIDEKIDFNIAEILQDKSLIIKKQITDSIFKSYNRIGFGKLLKSEIDLIMFDFSLKMIFIDINDKYIIDGELNYFLIQKQDIFVLSKKMKISENKIKNYIEQIGLIKSLLNNDKLALESFIHLFKKQKQDKQLIKKGKLRFCVANKLLKSYIEAKIDALGYISDYSFNNDILIVDIDVLFGIFNKQHSDIVNWVIEQNNIFNNDEKKELIKNLKKEKLLIGEITKSSSKIILSKFIGKTADIVIESIVDYFKDSYE